MRVECRAHRSRCARPHRRPSAGRTPQPPRHRRRDALVPHRGQRRRSEQTRPRPHDYIGLQALDRRPRASPATRPTSHNVCSRARHVPPQPTRLPTPFLAPRIARCRAGLCSALRAADEAISITSRRRSPAPKGKDERRRGGARSGERKEESRLERGERRGEVKVVEVMMMGSGMTRRRRQQRRA